MSTRINSILLSIFLAAIISAGPSFAQKGYTISGKINGCKGQTIRLCAVYGKEYVVFDSVALKPDCSFSFAVPDTSYTGLFALIINSKSAEIVFNKENIIVEIDAGKPENIKVIKSEENKVYSIFIKNSVKINDTIEKLTAKGQRLYEKDPKGNAAELKKLAKLIRDFEDYKGLLADSLIAGNPTLYASKIIKATLLPDFYAYMKKKNAAQYPNELAFLKEHFFDNIDFGDSTLLHSGVIFDGIGRYLEYFVSKPSVEAYKKAIDYIVVRTDADKNVREYVFNTLMRTFDNSDWEEVYTYIVDKYLETNSCSDNSTAVSLAEKSKSIKSLKTGSRALNIDITDLQGKQVILDSVKASCTLVFFWASWCEFCEKSIPDLKNLYDTYKPKGFEILAVSVDSVKQNWSNASSKHNISWINTCNLQGFKSKVVKDYNVWKTPTFFLLDKEKKIISRPANTTILKGKLEEMVW